MARRTLDLHSIVAFQPEALARASVGYLAGTRKVEEQRIGERVHGQGEETCGCKAAVRVGRVTGLPIPKRWLRKKASYQ